MKVLLIRLSSLGDVILATAAVEALASAPGVELHVLTKPAFAEVFRGHPAVRALLGWEPGDGVRAVARRLRAEAYDWVVDLHGNLRTRLLRAAGAGGRWSVYRKGALARRLAVLRHRPPPLGAHVVDRYAAALAPLGLSLGRPRPRVHPGQAERARVDALLRDAGWDGARLVALAPGARWATKAWPRERWVELLRELSSRRSGFPVLLGGAEERPLARAVLEASGVAGANLAGEGGVLETAAALERCSALVTNDSAPLHLATAVGTPVVAFFGPTVQGFGFAPLGEQDVVLEQELPCRPCSLHGNDRCPLGHHRCLAEISAAAAAQALVRVRGG